MANNARFTVLHEKMRGKIFEIDRDSMTIGRKDSNDISLPDGSVSGHHADIFRTEKNGQTIYILRDNDSTNKTRVNNVEISEHVLKNSDLITFGSVEVLFDGIADGNSDAGHFTQVTHTIDLSNTAAGTATTQTMVNFNPMAAKEERKQAIISRSLTALYILLGLASLILLYVVISNKINAN